MARACVQLNAFARARLEGYGSIDDDIGSLLSSGQGSADEVATGITYDDQWRLTPRARVEFSREQGDSPCMSGTVDTDV